MKIASRINRTLIMSFIVSMGVICLAATQAAALDIAITGSWTELVDKDDLINGVGTNLTGTYPSVTNANLASISGALSSSDAWQVTIKRIETTWDSHLQISARRTSGGTGSGSISGGQTYIQITTSDQTFFTGAGNRSGIRVQLRLTGASLQIPPNQYSATIQYTIIDTP